MVFLSTHPPSERARADHHDGRAAVAARLRAAPDPTLTGDRIDLDLGDDRGPMHIPIPF